jgi:4-hydroxy-tetrahydrodipicolinate synthase
MALGGAGGICVTANVLTAPLVEMTRGELDADEARGLHELLLPAVRDLFAEPSPAVAKSVLHARGVIETAAVREPLLQASAAATERALLSVGAALAGVGGGAPHHTGG